MQYITPRLHISQIYHGDVISNADVTELLSDKALTYLPNQWRTVTTAAQAEAWVQDRLAESAFFIIQPLASNKVIGCLMLYGLALQESNNQVKCGYIFNETYWGRGYASEVIQYLLEYLANLGSVVSIEGGVEAKNIGSVKVLTKNSFVYSRSEGDTEIYCYRFK